MSALDSTEQPEWLSDISEARVAWAAAQGRERQARSMLVLVVQEARANGAKLDDIATELGATRQYVSKMLKEAERRERDAEYIARRYSPENARRSLGRTGGYNRPQCGGCKRFLKAHGEQCPSCGYLEGGGYFAVPAQTSHLERWR